MDHLDPYSDWPFIARQLAKLRRPEDPGIGHVIERHLSWLGANAMVEIWRALAPSGMCSCGRRRDKLSELYPFDKGEQEQPPPPT